MKLRPYQKKAVKAVFNEWEKEDIRATLLVCATGTGKTVMFANVIKQLASEGKKTLILAHRGELLEQAQEKLYSTAKIEASLDKAAMHADKNALVVVGSMQTLAQDNRLQEYSPNHFDALVIDEAHHALSPSYQKITNYFSNAKILGVTATPDRGDMKDLSSVFDSIAYKYDIYDGIKAGYLSKIKIQTVPLQIDITNVGMQNGDFGSGELGAALDPYLETIAEKMAGLCHDRKILCFLPLISTSKKFKDILNHYGFRAAEVNGKSTDRKEIMSDFQEGKYNVLCNSMLVTEGVDIPSVDCIVNLRATRSRSLYQQIIGRGLRIAPNKDNLLVLDFLWLSQKHDLCRPARLLGDNEELTDEMTEIAENSEDIFDLEELRELAAERIRRRKEEIIRKREEALAREIQRQNEYAKERERLARLHALKKCFHGVYFKELNNPRLEYHYDEYGEFEFLQVYDNDLLSLSDDGNDLTHFEPMFRWEVTPATEKQLATIHSFGINAANIQFKGHASLIINTLFQRKEEGLCSLKQLKLLTRFGYHANHWTFEKASETITKLSKNGWKRIKEKDS